MRTIVLATGNAGKLRELTAMLADKDVTVLGLKDVPDGERIGDEIVEDGLTYAENALKKARHVARATGHVAVADDSGLDVDALDGAPGVFSARYAGSHGDDKANNVKLLQELANVPDERRTARFRCAMAMVAPTGEEALAEGSWEGVILRAEAGDNGFGYDPLFYVPTHGVSSAQLDPAVKNGLSHRGAALAALLEKWDAFWTRLEGD